MSESKTPTPRTDEQLTSSHWNTYCLNDREGTEYVPADFARTLELELNEANARAELWANRASGYVNDEQTYGTHRELYAQLTTAQQEIAELRKDKERLEKEVVREKELFIACASHLESPRNCEITEPGNYIFLLKIFPNGSHVSTVQKTEKDTSNEPLYPCKEWREWMLNKPKWPHIPFKSYDSAMKGVDSK